MNSKTAAIWPVLDAPRLLLPMVAVSIPAGFPSPADDYTVKRHDLNELLITHPLATFFWRVSGDSMIDAGIHDGAILVVNRALPHEHGNIVVAQVDADFTVKYLHRKADRVKLVPANPTYPEIRLREGQAFTIVGVVTASIKRFT